MMICKLMAWKHRSCIDLHDPSPRRNAAVSSPTLTLWKQCFHTCERGGAHTACAAPFCRSHLVAVRCTWAPAILMLIPLWSDSVVCVHRRQEEENYHHNQESIPEWGGGAVEEKSPRGMSYCTFGCIGATRGTVGSRSGLPRVCTRASVQKRLRR